MTHRKTTKLLIRSIVAATASFTLAASGLAQNNAFSAFPFTIDGQFTDGLGVGEWSDVTAATFFSQPGQSATPVPPALANSALYAALGNRAGSTAEPSLHLLYDFVPRTNPFAAPGEVVASVTFPVTLPGQQTGEKTLISVLFQGGQIPVAPGEVAGGFGGSFFDIFVDLDQDGIGDIFAAEIGLQGAVGFGPSPLASFPHLIAELGVSLRIPAEFGTPGGPLPGNGINPATGLYDPAPEFWGAAAGGDGAAGDSGVAAAGGLQPASAATLQILPDGSINVIPAPEPTSAALLLAGAAFLGARRRKA